MLGIVLNGAVIILLTLLTQIGGLAWFAALFAKRRFRVFLMVYACLSLASLWIAPLFGRVPLNCWSNENFRMQSGLYCVLNRHYVSTNVLETVQELSDHMSRKYPGTITLGLDGNFPFFDGFPLLPHLSHDDGRKLDLTFYYRDENGYLPGKTASPVGYFDFESGETGCTDRWLTLRWNLPWLQGLWPDYQLDPVRTAAAITWLASDPRVEKVFIEPHLRQTLNVNSNKVRFQGCHAARHDDHIHFQVR